MAFQTLWRTIAISGTASRNAGAAIDERWRGRRRASDTGVPRQAVLHQTDR